jgi:hypothetical protein
MKLSMNLVKVRECSRKASERPWISDIQPYSGPLVSHWPRDAGVHGRGRLARGLPGNFLRSPLPCICLIYPRRRPSSLPLTHTLSNLFINLTLKQRLFSLLISRHL